MRLNERHHKNNRKEGKSNKWGLAKICLKTDREREYKNSNKKVQSKILRLKGAVSENL